MISLIWRQCTGCLRYKPLDCFYHANKKKTTFKYKCKTCYRSDVKEYDREKWFAYVLRNATRRARKRKIPVSVNVLYLENLWKHQNGKCALTGIKMKQDIDAENMDTGSLDQIEPSMGYTEGNIQFVSVWANRAKTSLSMDEFRSRIIKTAQFMSKSGTA